MAQPENNGKNISDTNNPRPWKSKGKASHPDQIKSSKNKRKILEQVGMLQCLLILPRA